MSEDYLDKHFIKDVKGALGRWDGSGSGSGTASCESPTRVGYITLPSDRWLGDKSPFSQVVEIDGITENSKVDLSPNVEQLAIFHEKDLAFVTENDGGVVTVYAIGQKPENDYTIQATITEVIV